jgi:inner membrane transporter RhtA
MALEPAFALAIGFVALHQTPMPVAVVGVGLVVSAGIGAERSGTRRTAGRRLVESEPAAEVPMPVG